MLRTTNESTGNKTQNTQAENQDTPGTAGRANGSKSIENLSTVIKLTKSKRSDLPKANFTKVNFGTDFFTPKAKRSLHTSMKGFY